MALRELLNGANLPFLCDSPLNSINEPLKRHPKNLSESVPSQTVGELVCNHYIDPTLFVAGSITLGQDDGWREANERHKKKRQKKIFMDENLRSNEVKNEERAIEKAMERYYRDTPPDSWNIYSVSSNKRGVLMPGLSIAGQRLHPKDRGPKNCGKPKFDCRGTEVRIFLSALSYAGAMFCLEEYGFSTDPETYEPRHAWEFVLNNPSVPIWVEESALKAMASTTRGQLAVGLNGISSAGQKARSDILRPFLRKLAVNFRPMTVRFDYGESSTRWAQKLANLLNKKKGGKPGAHARWYTWEEGDIQKKTDDYFAWEFMCRYKGRPGPSIDPGQLPPEWRSFQVGGEEALLPYSRLESEWSTTTVNYEFEGTMIASARVIDNHRVIALVGATGTAKTKASVAAVGWLERLWGERRSYLGYITAPHWSIREVANSLLGICQRHGVVLIVKALIQSEMACSAAVKASRSPRWRRPY